MEASLDSVLIVIEPSFESLELSARINGLAAGIGMKNIWAVLNKVPSPDIASKMERELLKRNVNVIGSLHYDPEVFRSSLEGQAIRGGQAAREIGDILDIILGKER